MKVYVVGGAVRDALLGLPVSDTDWVVVGATPQAMLDAGYRAVGADFPVFLHPTSGEEYALARTERKSAPGYRGFTVDAGLGVTLEQDLSRRDLTINAMARDADGRLIDPYSGAADLAARCLRHVSAAFTEDPVRVMRVARFAARFTDFQVADETRALMRDMVDAGELAHLVPERVWQELAKGLMEAQPSRMFEVLRDCGALAVVLPEVDRLWGVPQPAEHHPEIDCGVHLLAVLDQCALRNADLPVRFAALCHDLGKGTTPRSQWPRHIGHEARGVALTRALAERWRAPTDCRELAEVTAREHGHVHASIGLGAAALLRLLERCDALRRPARFEQLLLACECDARGRLGFEQRPYPQADRLRRAFALATSINAAALSADALARGLSGPDIGRELRSAREVAIAAGID